MANPSAETIALTTREILDEVRRVALGINEQLDELEQVLNEEEDPRGR